MLILFLSFVSISTQNKAHVEFGYVQHVSDENNYIGHFTICQWLGNTPFNQTENVLVGVKDNSF